MKNLAFAFLFFSASLSLADEDPILTLTYGPKTVTLRRSALLQSPNLEKITVSEDPAYGGKSRTYTAVKATTLLNEFDIPDDAVIHFSCLDGFSAPLSTSHILNNSEKGAIAFVAVESPKEKWPPLAPNKPQSAGPFYLIWKNPKLSQIGREQWPFQLAKLEVKPSLATQYPQIVPHSKNPEVKSGFALFVKNCFNCHTLNRAGTSNLGPDLNIPNNPTKYLGEKYMTTLIRNPQDLRYWPGAKMTGFSKEILSDRDLKSILVYLKHMAEQKLK